MAKQFDVKAILKGAEVKDQYDRQLQRIRDDGLTTKMIEEAVADVLLKLPNASNNSLVVYGDPQSGKTELMICLTARLLDSGYPLIVHLVTDSLDLLSQNLKRFKAAGLAPAPRDSSDVANTVIAKGHQSVVFCKKNCNDLDKLITAVSKAGQVVVIDDEADYATPNAKINKKEQTKINKLVKQLLGSKGKYIGVTATPARLNLNNTFDNKTETWVWFKPHPAYTGQETFFPPSEPIGYRLTRLQGAGSSTDARRALARFCITVAYLNTAASAPDKPERNYSFLVHTSGRITDHAADRKAIEATMDALVSRKGTEFVSFAKLLFNEAQNLYPDCNPEKLTQYVVANGSRSAFVVLNSKRNKVASGSDPTIPTCPFTIIIGGNIVSRGVTFPDLLAMFFTRDVKTKLQQDTYIQRARMFGARGKYLKYFELTIPAKLYSDWQRCFSFHRLALESIQNGEKAPVWISDSRISIAQAASIDRATVNFNRGEMSFALFETDDVASLDEIVRTAPQDVSTLESIAGVIGPAMPKYLIEYLKDEIKRSPNSLAIHESSSIQNQKGGTDQARVSRKKGFMGQSQLERNRFPVAVHHVKIFHNGRGKARVFYKNTGGAQFVQNQRS